MRHRRLAGERRGRSRLLEREVARQPAGAEAEDERRRRREIRRERAPATLRLRWRRGGHQTLRNGLVEPGIERFVEQCVLPPQVGDARRERGIARQRRFDFRHACRRKAAVHVGVDVGVVEGKRAHVRKVT